MLINVNYMIWVLCITGLSYRTLCLLYCYSYYFAANICYITELNIIYHLQFFQMWIQLKQEAPSGVVSWFTANRVVPHEQLRHTDAFIQATYFATAVAALRYVSCHSHPLPFPIRSSNLPCLGVMSKSRLEEQTEYHWHPPISGVRTPSHTLQLGY